MLKKVIGIAVILVLSLSLFGCISPEVHPPDCGCEICVPPGNHGETCNCAACKMAAELAGYKGTEKAALEAYAAGKGQSNYPAEDWIVMQTAVIDGKVAIDAATDIAGVDTARDAAKAAIDAVLTIEEILGTFYTLQEAYDEGLLTVEELKSIAYYMHGGILPDNSEDIGFAPLPKTPETLSAEVEKAIKETRAYDYRAYLDENGSTRYPDAKAGDFPILEYFGTYNHCVVVILGDKYGGEYPSDRGETEIAGVKMFEGTVERTVVWKAN